MIDIQSDSLYVNVLNEKITFIGNVKLVCNSVSLFADQVKIEKQCPGNKSGTASSEKNKIVIMYKENPKKSELIEGKGLQVKFNEQGQFELIGKASITRYLSGDIVERIQGNRILYSEINNSYQAFGDQENGCRIWK